VSASSMLLAFAAASTAPIATPPPAERAAIFKAASFAQHGGQWKTANCEGLESVSYSPGAIETYRDLNGDGRPEAVVTEGGAICYGNTGQYFWLLTKQANGSWKRMVDQLGMPEFLRNRGVDGWPDIRVGGPGFCFPVLRWNGRAYVQQRFEYEGKPCRR